MAETLWLYVNSYAVSKMSIKIFDSKGALLGMQQINLLRGNNLLNINMKKIPAGTYDIIVNCEDGQMQKAVKVVKL